LRPMLDFVPNHTGLDHPWVASCRSARAPGGPAGSRGRARPRG
jgi:glycosidase